MSSNIPFSDILLHDMQNKDEPSDDHALLIRESIQKLFPDDPDAWLAVSNLNNSQIDELAKVLLVKKMFLPDTCDFILDFVRDYIKLNVSKNAHGRHDIRDIFQGTLSLNPQVQGRSFTESLKGILGR
ncbi:hypothetical protein [uncultured Methanolobus sp.]|uniref:hypothetical protein n=1 Tax=uncultured Methanolobus sp. TaxID=218300 RepID=UPI0029C9445E|nr:hypothetical protein [uncultured Methanolobus sp.]